MIILHGVQEMTNKASPRLLVAIPYQINTTFSRQTLIHLTLHIYLQSILLFDTMSSDGKEAVPSGECG